MIDKLFLTITLFVLLNGCSYKVTHKVQDIPPQEKLINLCNESDVILIGTVKFKGIFNNSISGIKSTYQMCLYESNIVLKVPREQYNLSEDIPIYHLISSEKSYFNNKDSVISSVLKEGTKFIIFAKIGTPYLDFKDDKIPISPYLPRYLVTFDIEYGAISYFDKLEEVIVDILRKSKMLCEDYDEYKESQQEIEDLPTREKLIRLYNDSYVIFVGKVKFVGIPPLRDSGVIPTYQVCVYDLEKVIKGKSSDYLMKEIPVYHIIAGGRTCFPMGHFLSPLIFKVGERLIIFAKIGTPGLSFDDKKIIIKPNMVRYLLTFDENYGVIPYSNKLENSILEVSGVFVK